MTPVLPEREIFLQPGEFYFGQAPARIRTLLGSCVAITLWHPRLLLGGMCHYMLPRRNRYQHGLSGKYADEAMQLFQQQAHHYGTRMQEYQIKLFGGGNMFLPASYSAYADVALNNITAGHMLLAQYGLTLTAQDLGLTGHRTVIFDLTDGHVWVKHQRLQES